MALFKCKMCGGTLEINNETVATCEYCGTQQTLPRLDDDRRANMYDRANHFRRNNEFDKAMGIYEQILNEDSTDAESYWSLVLCRYGIEYVEDPATRKRVPTVNRAQFTSIFDDDNYKSALQYADGYQKNVYEDEAKAINEIQKGILEISQKEEPFDVFICYKESDNNGRRTPDSVLATELYHELVKEDFKAFFSRITLEDKLGTAYEPYIFAALNSAKVMVVLGTRPEHFNAVWVKNEWSRYLALIRKGSGKTLIPAYKDMDPYDLPEEFSHLQAQDMSKLGFMQDLIRGIKKITAQAEPTPTIVKETVVTAGNSSVAPLLKRVFMFLEDGDFAGADEYCEKVLDIDPENAEAYLGKLMADLKVRDKSYLKNCTLPFSDNGNYLKIIKFGDDALKNEIQGDIDHIIERNRISELTKRYNEAKTKSESAISSADYQEVLILFKRLSGFKDSEELYNKYLKLKEEIEIAEKDEIYNYAVSSMNNGDWHHAILIFQKIPDWKDSKEKIEECNRNIAKEAAEKKAKIIKYSKIGSIALAVIIVLYLLIFKLIVPVANYSKAEKFAESGNTLQAIQYYGKAGSFRGAIEKAIELCGGETVSAGEEHTVALKSDGTVVAVGSNYDGECNVSKWTDIASVSAGYDHTVGLKADGTVVAVGNNVYGQCNVSEWTDIAAVSAGSSRTIGLKADGTVVSTDGDLSEWTDIVAVSAGDYHTVGLKADGTVVAVGSNGYGKCNVSEWTDIVAVSVGDNHTVGLKADGTVVATKYSGIGYYYGQCDVSEWTDIVAVSAGDYHTVGLKADGTVVAAGTNVSEWTDIVAVSAGNDFTVGIKSDGTVVAVGDNYYGQCNVSKWTDCKICLSDDEIAEMKKTYGENLDKIENEKAAKYSDAAAAESKGEKIKAAMLYGSASGYKDAKEKSFTLWDTIAERETVSVAYSHTVGLRANGTVVAVGTSYYGECNVSKWTDIASVSAGYNHTVGLKADGTVVAVGNNVYGQCNVSEWTDIVAVSAGDDHTVGLKSDGTVVATGNSNYGQCYVSKWKNIIDIAAGDYYTVGLKADGTVVTIGNNDDDRRNVSKWTDIVAVSVGDAHTVGLKADGTVVSTARDLSEWTDIVAVSAGSSRTIGLKADGTVVSTARDLSEWADIVAVSVGYDCFVGLKADGTVVSTDSTVSKWKTIKLP